ncbi:MAG TPA: HDOD domain-containing protein [Pirellulales bacterium]|nr:HDOD domain-containing protein [Pirellulales bacterium]
MEVSSDTLAELLNHSRHLYSLPAVALEVLELTNDPQIDTSRLKTCIERDPALTIKLLRVVNSSLFGLSRRVSDLSQALGMLGTKPLKMLVLGFGLPEPLFAGLARDVLNRYWKHTLTRAVAARELSERLWKMPGDELFVAGLLRDLGRLVLIQGLGRPYVEMLHKADWPRDELCSLERRLIGFDHGQLTAGLLEQWGLPEPLVAAVQTPDNREEIEALSGEARSTAQIIYVAEKLAELLADEQVVALRDLLSVTDRGRFSEEQLSAIAASLDETVSQLADVLSLDLPQGLAYAEVLARAYLQLSLVASDAAVDLVRVEEVGTKLRDFADREEARSVSAAAASFRADKANVRRDPSETAMGSITQTGGTPVSLKTQRAKAKVHRAELPAATVIQPVLKAQIAAAATLCRQRRKELSLLLVEIDNHQDFLFVHGEQDVARLRQELLVACRAVAPDGRPPLELDPARLALVLAGCDRPAAADVGHSLLHEVRRNVGGGAALTISIGASTVAVPAKNFDAVEIVRSAERCLRAARLSGGNCFKSIEAY